MATGIIPKYADGTDTGWQAETGTMNDGAHGYVGTIYWRKIGCMVSFFARTITLQTTLSGSNVALMSGIFANCKPYGQVTFPAGNPTKFGQVLVNQNSGTLSFYKNTSENWDTSTLISFTGFFLTAV